MKLLIGLFGLLMVFNTSQGTKINDFYFLKGTWKVEKKESYEVWQIKGDKSLEGSSYKIKNGNKQVEEHLSIKLTEGKIIYTAIVPNQNNDKPVDFIQNIAVKDKLSFENLSHDFPKKIQYKKLNDTTIFVAVLGDHDKGFSYRMFKHK